MARYFMIREISLSEFYESVQNHRRTAVRLVGENQVCLGDNVTAVEVNRSGTQMTMPVFRFGGKCVEIPAKVLAKKSAEDLFRENISPALAEKMLDRGKDEVFAPLPLVSPHPHRKYNVTGSHKPGRPKGSKNRSSIEMLEVPNEPE